MNCLRSLVGPELDPLQFTYQSCIGVDDAIIYLMHRSYLHREDVGSAVRIMFFDLSSAFNTIWPLLLEGKPLRARVDCHLATWIINYLSDRPLYLRLQNCVSDMVVCSTGAPQGTVLAPFLFTLYTSDFRYNSIQFNSSLFV